MGLRSLTPLALVALLTLPLGANAVPIRISYDGVVTSTSEAGLGFAVGDSISGWFDLDTDILVESGPGTGVYNDAGPFSSSAAQLANEKDNAIVSAPDNRIFLRDGSDGPGSPSGVLQWGHNLDVFDATAWIDIDDLLAGVASSHNVSGFDRHEGFVSQNHFGCPTNSCSNGYSFDVNTLQIEAADVPAPAGLALLLVGIAGAVVGRSRG